jgi:hypothetical protein
MKRTLLTALTGLAFGFITAQSIQIQDLNNNPIANGSTIDLWYDVSASAPVADFPVKNTSGTNKYINCLRTEISVVSGTNNLICWLACYSPSQSLSPTVNIASQNTHLFSSHYYPNGMLGTTTLYYTFWDSLNPSDSAWFTVKWHITPASVNSLVQPSVSISNIYPNPAVNNTTISYQLSNADNAIIKVYNVVGEEVKQVSVSAREGSVTFSVSDLRPGIYFCSFLSSDKILATRKLTVTH